MNVILVHGTWSPDAPWIQEGSDLREAIKHHCPKCKKPVNFIWSGENSVKGRRRATDELVKKIEEMEQKTAEKQILIAHSHGGNVVLNALHGEVNNKKIKDMVSGVVCLNTPFFTLLRKDTYYMVQFAIISTLMFLSFAFWYPVLVRDDLPFWPIWSVCALVLMCLLFRKATKRNVKGWIDNRWQGYEKKFQQPRVKTIPFLCLNSGADEAFTFLSVIDGFTNIPSIIFTRYVGKILLLLFFILGFLHKLSIRVDLFSLHVIKSVESSPLGFALAIFRLPDLNSFDFHFSPDWPILADFFEVTGLAALYAILFVLAVMILSVMLGFFSRATTGTWKELMLPLFARQFTTLTPIRSEKVEFHQYDPSDNEVPLHSSLYKDPKAIDHVVRWINNL